MAARTWDNLIIHCSDSSFGSTAVIRQWHLQRKWRDVGYHFVIPNGYLHKDFYLSSFDGSVETGRDLDGDLIAEKMESGAHTYGYNANSIGICLIGKNVFTPRQISSLENLVLELCNHFNIKAENIKGHRDLSSKTCPNMDISWLRDKIKLIQS